MHRAQICHTLPTTTASPLDGPPSHELHNLCGKARLSETPSFKISVSTLLIHQGSTRYLLKDCSESCHRFFVGQYTVNRMM